MDDLQRLLIERACGRLVAQYCHVIDHGEAARVAELFTEDGVWASPENTMTGRAAILKGFTNRQNNKGRMSRHVCNNLLLDVIDENTASGVVYLTLYRHDAEEGRRTSPAQPPAVVGEYRDRFRNTADGWRFERREIVVSFAPSKA
jgi:ketosteroid isomerase-like protein